MKILEVAMCLYKQNIVYFSQKEKCPVRWGSEIDRQTFRF